MSRVLVVGGGPAGSACAITTAKAGLETIVFESGPRKRDKICGDILLPDSQRILNTLEILDQVKSNAIEVPKMLVYLSDEKRIILEVPTLNLQRRVFDQILRDSVVESGGQVYYNSNITEIKVTDNLVSATNSSGEVHRGDIIVLATGSRINLSRKLGFEFEEGSVAAAIRGYLENTSGLKDNVLYFREDMSGYGWIIPCPENTLNVGFGIHNSKDSLQSLFNKFLEEKVKAFSNEHKFVEKPKGYPLRVSLKKKHLCSNRVILIGENIDCVYDLTGDGIGPAMESGILAGEVITQAKQPYGTRELEVYEKMIKTRMGKTHHNFALIRKLLSYGWINYAFTNLLASSDIARTSFSRYLSRV